MDFCQRASRGRCEHDGRHGSGIQKKGGGTGPVLTIVIARSPPGRRGDHVRTRLPRPPSRARNDKSQESSSRRKTAAPGYKKRARLVRALDRKTAAKRAQKLPRTPKTQLVP